MLDELSVLNPLTKLRRLHIKGCADDPRLKWLSLGHGVLVMTWCFRMYRSICRHAQLHHQHTVVCTLHQRPDAARSGAKLQIYATPWVVQL
jgi:hypothetical protein